MRRAISIVLLVAVVLLVLFGGSSAPLEWLLPIAFLCLVAIVAINMLAKTKADTPGAERK
jgi:Ca2+/Na+ antiporter